MSITDAEYMLRDGSTALSATETGDGVKVGPCPLRGMLIRIYRPSAGTTFTVKFSESDDDVTYTDMAQPASTAYTTAGVSHVRAFWTKQYVRHQVTACTLSFGAVEIGFVQGGKPS
ncbi:MAG TPA: hypothetical protein VM537_35615 [Anaerolineae bacterium]|nr:hypothetical protein [Anaerolineae bacterium]